MDSISNVAGVLDKPLVFSMLSQPAFTCSKLTIKALEQGVKYVES